LLAFSHLRWDFVHQRPQHVLSRLAASRRVLMIEEPVHDEGVPRWERLTPAPNVEVYRPHTPVRAPGFCAAQLAVLRRMLYALRRAQRIERCLAWLYTPMALPLATDAAPELIVYDCMDELSAFLHAPPELLAREAELLGCADLVFTGGPSLYHAKRRLHADVHCFPSSVEVAHFAGATGEAEDQRGLPRPRLGFAGVIDERLDRDVLDAVARARPDWQLVMVGPVVKIDPATLPRHPNIAYLGQRPYAALPAFLAGWDVGLLPFALNRATRFISPTKTLEYMAAGRPVVSTSITDVAEPYGDVVYLGDGPEGFLAACERALAASAAERAERAARVAAILARTSWDVTAGEMDRLMGERLALRAPALASRAASSSSGGPTRALTVPGGTA
jgi:UDP-galactopyranose mutase